MSYCRWGRNSDVYVYPASRDGVNVVVCCACDLTLELTDVVFPRTAAGLTALLAHLDTHLDLGRRVPDHALERVRRELEELEEADGGGR